MEMKQLWILLKLSNLAKLFDHREMWSYVTSLKSLAWAVVKEQSPALVSLSPFAFIAALETSGVFRYETFPEGYIARVVLSIQVRWTSSQGKHCITPST